MQKIKTNLIQKYFRCIKTFKNHTIPSKQHGSMLAKVNFYKAFALLSVFSFNKYITIPSKQHGSMLAKVNFYKAFALLGIFKCCLYTYIIP